MKRIEYICPVDYIRGNISGRQDIEYNGGSAYALADGDRVSAGNYQPRLVAAVRHLHRRDQSKYFSVRTRSTVNMTARMRENLALMGGVGALFAALLNNKTATIYAQCVAACPKGWTLRQFITPLIRQGLTAKDEYIAIADGVSITNPWIHTGAQTLTIAQAIIDKFSDVLS